MTTVTAPQRARARRVAARSTRVRARADSMAVASHTTASRARIHRCGARAGSTGDDNRVSASKNDRRATFGTRARTHRHERRRNVHNLAHPLRMISHARCAK